MLRTAIRTPPRPPPSLIPRLGASAVCLVPFPPREVGPASLLHRSAMANPDAFVGKWRLCSTDGFDDYMKELGVGMALRKMGSMAKPDCIISRDGDKITLKSESTFKNHEICFVPGKEFDEDTVDGRKTKTIITIDDNNVMTQHQQWDGKETTIRRKIVDGKLIVECDMNGVKCTRVYQKV